MSPFACDLLSILLSNRPHPDNRFLVPLRSRRLRRVLVVGWLLTLVLTGAGFIVTSRFAISLLWLVPLLIGSRLGWLASIGTRNLSMIPDAEADERERAVRDRAYRTAYRILLFPFTLVTVGPAVMAGQERLRLGDTLTLTPAMAPYIYTWFMGVYLLYFILPTAVLAWTEPDPPLESEPPLEPRFA